MRVIFKIIQSNVSGNTFMLRNEKSQANQTLNPFPQLLRICPSIPGTLMLLNVPQYSLVLFFLKTHTFRKNDEMK